MHNKKRYFCDGPEGNFVAADQHLANLLVEAIDKDKEWTITEIEIEDTDLDYWPNYSDHQ